MPVRGNSCLIRSILVALLLLFSLSLAACKESDAIVEKILDQNSKNVDYNNPDKVYVPDESSKVTVKDLSMNLSNVPDSDHIKYDAPEKKGDEKNGEVDKTDYDTKAASNKTASSSKSNGSKKRSDASDGTGDSSKKNSSGSGGNSKNDGSGSSDSAGSETGSHGYDMNDDSYQTRTYDSTYGSTEDLPKNVSTIVAAGEVATMVQVLGDKGSLAGSSSDYLGEASVKAVFANKGISDVKAIWSGSGASTKGSEIDAIISLNPDACVVYPGQFTATQERVIAQNCPSMQIITVPKPTSADNIATDMKVIATLLSTKTDGKSLDIDNEYTQFVKGVVDDAESCHSGGGVVTYNGVDYNNSDGTKIVTVTNPATCDPKWTLYISGWDDDAKVTARYSGSTLFTDTGAAYTRTGWSWSPISYYMSVGGVINNAAAYGPLSTNTVQPVLEYNEIQVSYSWTDFCVKVDETNGGGSFTKLRGFHVLFNARDGADSSQASETHPLGSDDFNTVIVKTKAIKKSLQAASEESDGLYTKYDYVTSGETSGYGRLASSDKSKSIIWTTVKGDVGYDILVNPCGYIGSWTDGSIESPLEALWIAAEYYGYDKDKLESKIKDFYNEFYGGYVPDVDKILDGSYAE